VAEEQKKEHHPIRTIATGLAGAVALKGIGAGTGAYIGSELSRIKGGVNAAKSIKIGAGVGTGAATVGFGAGELALHHSHKKDSQEKEANTAVYGLAKRAFVTQQSNIDLGQLIGNSLKRVNQLDDLAGLAIVAKSKKNQQNQPQSQDDKPKG
jgi:hypothetical protein